MENRILRNDVKVAIIKKSIEVMQNEGVNDEIIKNKMMQSFSLDEDTIEKIMKDKQ